MGTIPFILIVPAMHIYNQMELTWGITWTIRSETIHNNNCMTYFLKDKCNNYMYIYSDEYVEKVIEQKFNQIQSMALDVTIFRLILFNFSVLTNIYTITLHLKYSKDHQGCFKWFNMTTMGGSKKYSYSCYGIPLIKTQYIIVFIL
jgi:hypothetical protein